MHFRRSPAALQSALICLLPAICVVLGLTSCAELDTNDPARNEQYASLVNRLSWTEPLSGKRDGLRSSWPVKTLAGQRETFPLAQIKQCDKDGAACAWGVMLAHRRVDQVVFLPNAISVDLLLAIDIDRRQQVREPGFEAMMAIPADVPALRSRQELKQRFTLPYGKVQHIDLDFGLGFDLCAQRYDSAGRALDICEIPYI